MKKKLHVLLLSILLICYSNNSNAQTWNWASGFGSISGVDQVNDIVVDAFGNSYVTGNYSGTIQTPVDTITSSSTQNIFIGKFDVLGQVVWLRSAGGNSGFDSGIAIDIDNSSNVYITGDIIGNVTFDTISINIPANTASTYIAKYDTDGAVQWVGVGIPTMPTFFVFNTARDIEIDDFGNIYIIGQRNDDPIVFGSVTVPGINNNFTYLVKYDTNGNALWGISPSANSTPYEIEIHNNQIYYFYNEFNSNEVKFKKFDLQGNLSFTSSTLLTYNNSPSSFSIDFEIAQNGKINVSNQFFSLLTANNTTFTASNGNFIITQFDTSGVFQWIKQIGSSTNDFRGGMALDSLNNIYYTASFISTVTVDTFTVQTVGQDLFVVKLTENGDAVWLRSAENGNSNATEISIDANGNTYVVGNFNGTATFDDNQVLSSGTSDGFIAKLGCEPQRVAKVVGDTLVCLGTQTYEAVKNSVGNNFIWTVSGGGTVTNTGNIATINWTQTGVYTVTVTQFNDCGLGKDFTFNVTVKDVPILPIINGDSTDCLGSATYNVTNNFDTDNYAWTVSGGGNLFPIGNTAIINWAISGDYTLEVVASNLCGVSPTGTLDIDIFEIPTQPSPIVGNTNVCASTQTYTIPSINNVDYTWSLSSGGTIITNNNTATINWTTAGTHTLSVIPSNECGIGSARSILVTVTEVPQQPSTVVGNLTVCQGLQSYSVIGNTTTSYNWTISGGGNLTASNNNATVNWQTSGTYTMTITPSNICGTGTPRTVTVTVLDLPNQPNEILGIDTVCIGTQNYSVAPQSGVNFNWQLSSGGTVLPTNNLATINWTTPGTHTITVTPSNSCGTGQSKSRLIFVKNTNAQITTITGENEPCLNIENYSVPSVSGLTYNWNVTGGGTITDLGNAAFVDWTNTGIYTLSVATSDGCSNSLTVSVDDVPTQPSQIFGDTTVCLSFYNYSILNTPDINYIWTLSGGGILTQSGNAANVNWTQAGIYTLTATPSNDCGLGTSRSQTITVLDIPNQPSTIATTATNDTLACLNTETYSVNSQSNVTYNFSLSGNGTLVQNQNSVDITWLTASVDNELLVTTSNICGTSPQQSLKIDVLDIPQVAPIQGDNDVCLNTNQVYAVPLVTENTYNWSLSSGGILAVVNDSAFVNWQTVGTHTLSVLPSNICGSGQIQTLQITVKDVPNQPTGFIGNTNACQTLQGYSITAETDVNYSWNLSSGGSITALNNAANVNWTTAGNHILTITPNNECGIGTPFNQQITVQNIPIQPTAIIGSDSTCLNTLNNYSTALQNNLTYNWNLSNGGILSQNINTSTINWNGIGNQTLSVTASNVCGTSAPQTKNITVLDVPNQPIISGDLNVCQNDTETYIATSDATNYTWTTSGGTVNGNTVNWTTLGNQTLTVTPTNFCGNGTSASANILVETVPNITQSILGDSVVCLGISAYNLPQINGVNYTWTISAGGSITALNNAANINWTTAGIYTITAIPSNNCGNGNTITKQVTVNTIPTQPTAITGIDSTCLNTSNPFTTTLQSNVNYTWSLSNNSGIITPNINNAAINWNTTGVQTVSVSATNLCGTSPITTKDITVLDVPNQPIISGDLNVCQNDTETYIATSNATNYTWTTSGGTVNGNTVNWTTLGNQTLTVTPTNFCGNGTSASANIIVGTVPNITQSILGDSVVCSGISAYTLPQITGVNYTWSISGGGAITGLGNVANINWISPGIHTITAISSNDCGNGNTITKQITVRDVPNQPSAIQGADTVCTVAETYSVILENGITYNWTLGSGGVITASGNTATIIWTDEGTHTIIVTPQDVCGALGTPITKTVSVQIAPILTANIDGDIQVCNGETDIYAVATGLTDWTYNWTIDNGNSVVSNGNQATVDFNIIGNTRLTLEVNNQCGTAPIKTIDISVEDNAPNVNGIINGDTLVCRNSDAIYTISGSSDFDYNWSVNGGGIVSSLSNSGLVSWQDAGVYEVGVYASNFCGAGDTIFTTVMVENSLQRPQITFINDTLFSSNPTLSQWYLNGDEIDNAMNFAFRPVNSGIYSVESENICGVTPLSNDFPFGLESGLFLYPNPGRYFITLRVPPYLTWYSIDAIDQTGRIVMQPIQYDGSNEILIDVRNLEGGVYWFRIETELILLYRKVVILD
ncbi:MAG: hypothetical protein AB8G11_08975 [Saprospiraceae bacterium]